MGSPYFYARYYLLQVSNLSTIKADYLHIDIPSSNIYTMGDCKSNHGHGSYRDLCVDALQQSGFRVTQARLAVIDCINGACSPLSAPEVFELLSKSKGSGSVSPDKVSVYRVLEALLSLNLVHRVGPTGGYLACKHLECGKVHHVMSRCTGCSIVEEADVPSEVIAPLLQHMKDSLSFTPDSHLVHIDGLCKGCSQKN